jgi:hypothetical protein
MKILLINRKDGFATDFYLFYGSFCCGETSFVCDDTGFFSLSTQVLTGASREGLTFLLCDIHTTTTEVNNRIWPRNVDILRHSTKKATVVAALFAQIQHDASKEGVKRFTVIKVCCISATRHNGLLPRGPIPFQTDAESHSSFWLSWSWHHTKIYCTGLKCQSAVNKKFH